MKKRFIFAAAASLLLSACTAQGSEGITETVSATTAAILSDTEAAADTSEALTETQTAAEPTETTAKTVTEIPETEITETTAKPMPDKTTAPVLTVSNIDHKTNYMSWTAIEGAESYMLYLLNEETGEFEEYGGMDDTACNDIELEPNTKYTYTVAAQFPDGSMGTMSESVSIYTRNKFGNNISNIEYESHSTTGGAFSSQGDMMYLWYYPDWTGNDGEFYSVSADGTNVKTLKSDFTYEFLNIIGDKIYYVDQKNHCICSANIDGSNERVIIDTESEYFKKYKGWFCHFNYLYAVNDTLYFCLYLQMMFETDPFYEWYSLDLNDGTFTYLCDINSDYEYQVIAADENFITFGRNYRTIEGYDEEGYEIYGDYVYEYGEFITCFTDGSDQIEETMVITDKPVITADSSLYIDQNGVYYVCNIADNSIYPIGKVYHAYNANGIVYYTNADGLFKLDDGGSTLLCELTDEAGSNICYADGNKIVLKREYFSENYNPRNLDVIPMKYWVIDLDSLEIKLLWSSEEYYKGGN